MMRKLTLILLFVVFVLAIPAVANANDLFKKRDLPVQYVDKVNNFFSQHRWGKGKELLDEGLELYPDNAQLHYLAGRYWYNGKNWDKARYHLVKACQIRYNYPDAKQLLVNIEEITKNYSSAICYVNELLEVNPYWKGLWLRKVDLYKKMGNFEQANILLHRLSQIYPNDASINSDYYGVLETTYQQARLRGDLDAAKTSLHEIVSINPKDADYQLAYANILISQGKYNEAMDNLLSALNARPGNYEITKKGTDILMTTGQYSIAVSLAREQLSKNPSPNLRMLYNNLVAESARIEYESEPYQLYAKLWASSHDPVAMQYLLRESVKCGYFDDTIYYLEQKRLYLGDSPQCSMTEYDVYTRMGNYPAAQSALERGIVKFPEDYDINLNLSRIRLSQASELMADENYNKAVDLLEFVRQHGVDPDMRALAVRRLALCYRETNNSEKTVQMLRERLKTEPEYAVTIDYAAFLEKQDKREEAVMILHDSYLESRDTTSGKALANAYRETAYVYLKEKLQSGQISNLQPITDLILVIDPDDYWGLRYSLKTAEDPLPYAKHGMEVYPEDPTFAIKAASLMSERGQDREAVSILEPYVNQFQGDQELQNTYAGVCDAYAAKLIKAKEYDKAASVLDNAISHSPNNDAVLYSRGLVYEKQHNYDSAYVYQQHYTPSLLEKDEYIQKMRGLHSRSLKNSADVGVDMYRFTNSNNLRAIFSFGYSHAWKNDIMQLRLNYSGRDYAVDNEDGSIISAGGVGLQAIAGYTHEFGPLVTLQAQAGYANQFFPKVSADLSGTVHLPADWDVSLGASMRLLQDNGLMIGGNLQGFHTWNNIYAGLKLSMGSLYKVMYVNTSALFRFYPYQGGRSYVQAQLGVGTAPEITFLSYYVLPTAYNHLNSFAALTASWAISQNMSVLLSGTCNTLYQHNQSDNRIIYSNLLLANVTFVVYF